MVLDLMAFVRAVLRPTTSEGVKSQVTKRLQTQERRIERLDAVGNRIREDYRLQDERMAGRR